MCSPFILIIDIRGYARCYDFDCQLSQYYAWTSATVWSSQQRGDCHKILHMCYDAKSIFILIFDKIKVTEKVLSVKLVQGKQLFHTNSIHNGSTFSKFWS